MNLILEVDDLHVRYGKVEAVHGASLKVEAGQDRDRDRSEWRGQVHDAQRDHGRAAGQWIVERRGALPRP